MGRWWSPASAAVEPRSVQLLLLGVALVAASFYAGTLFGPSASPELVLPPSRPQSPDSSRSKGAYLHLPSSVWLRSDPLVDRISSPLRGFLEKKIAAHGHCCSRFLASCCNLCSVFRLIVTGFVLYAPALFDCDLGIALCQQQRLGRSEDQYVKIVYIANFSSRS